MFSDLIGTELSGARIMQALLYLVLTRKDARIRCLKD